MTKKDFARRRATKKRVSRSKRHKAAKRRCEICDREAGSLLDRSGHIDHDAPPLGKLQKCPLCGLWVCPDCHDEADCCFREKDDHEDDPDWAPVGWKRTADGWVPETMS